MRDIRWKQRHSNYANMLKVLKNELGHRDIDKLGELEQIGLAKSFEMCYELMWKLLKDYLEENEVEIGLLSPKNILKTSASCGLLEQIGADGDILMECHKTRNELAHIYDSKRFAAALSVLKSSYLAQFIAVDEFFSRKTMGGGHE